MASRKTIDRPGQVRRFALSQLGIAAYTTALFTLLGHGSWLPGLRHVIAASTYTTFHPAPELFDGQVNVFTLYSLLDIPLWTCVLLGVPTFLMGYGFPQLMRAASGSLADVGKSVSTVYFANIIGSTIGTLLIGISLIHAAGIEATIVCLAIAGVFPIAWVLVREFEPRQLRQGFAAVAAVAVIGAATLALPGKGQLLRALHYASHPGVEVVALAEDRSGTVLLKNQREVITFPQEERALGSYRLYIDGANHGGTPDLTSVMPDPLASLALAAHRTPSNVLCIGLGNGAMCASAVRDPSVERLTIIELNTALPGVLRHTANGREVLESPKTRLLQDDGRRWLLANADKRFDVVMMFPLHAAHAHSGALFSKEFFELVKSRLTPGGVLFFRSVDGYSTARTAASTFEHIVRADGAGYIASAEPLAFDTDSLGWTARDLAEHVEADRETILEGTAGAPLNRDLRPRSEFYMTYAHRRWLAPSAIHDLFAAADRSAFAQLAAPVRLTDAEGSRTTPR